MLKILSSNAVPQTGKARAVGAVVLATAFLLTTPGGTTASAHQLETPAASSASEPGRSDDGSARLTTQRFEIYYGTNCTSASRIYTGTTSTSGEAWVNDTFNRTTHGTSGNGQKIYHNAASIVVNSAIAVKISTNKGLTFNFRFQGNTGKCQNFPANVRNYNDHWLATIY